VTDYFLFSFENRQSYYLLGVLLLTTLLFGVFDGLFLFGVLALFLGTAFLIFSRLCMAEMIFRLELTI